MPTFVGKHVTAFDKELKAVPKSTYYRPRLHAQLSIIQARQDEIAKEFADYINQGNKADKYPYFAQLAGMLRILLRSYQEARKHHSLVDVWFKSGYLARTMALAFSTTKELLPRGIKAWFKAATLLPLKFSKNKKTPAASTEMIVKTTIDNRQMRAFKATEIFKTNVNHQKTTMQTDIVNDSVHERTKDSQFLVYAHLTAPRSGDFINTVKGLRANGIKIKKIAGQDYVPVKCEVNANDKNGLNNRVAALQQLKYVEPILNYRDHIHPNRQFCLFDVPVTKLQKTLQRMEKIEGVHVNHIHNF